MVSLCVLASCCLYLFKPICLSTALQNCNNICRLKDLFIFSVYQMSQNPRWLHLQFVLLDKQSKIPKYPVYKEQRKKANLSIWKLHSVAFLLDKLQSIDCDNWSFLSSNKWIIQPGFQHKLLHKLDTKLICIYINNILLCPVVALHKCAKTNKWTNAKIIKVYKALGECCDKLKTMQQQLLWVISVQNGIY